MGNKIDRTGEERLNNFGSRMIITEYRSRKDIDIYFPEYDWIAKHIEYKNFKNGNIKCPYEKRVYGVGYIGEGKYKASENRKNTKCYDTWCKMLQRCYDPKLHEKHLTYVDCKVCDEWLCFQNFAEWFYNNYYEIDDERMCLDKDILHKGNKIYSPNNCVFVPHNINLLFVKCDKSRGNCPIGISYHKRGKKFVARCNVYDFKENKSELKYLGCYDTSEEAFKIYKEFKEQNIKDVADHYKDLIPVKLYDVMYNYQVEITD